MPGNLGFAAYGPALSCLPATSREISEKTGLTPKGAGELMRRLWALKLVYPGGVVGRADLTAGGQAKTVWHLGDGEAVSLRVSKIRPRAQHIFLASIARALEQAMTTKEVAEETGVSLTLAQQRIKSLHDAGMIHVCEWAQDAIGRPVARYEWGQGKDVPKPKPQSSRDKWRKYADKKRAPDLQSVWGRPAANTERIAA